jgi:hypothetical protein
MIEIIGSKGIALAVLRKGGRFSRMAADRFCIVANGESITPVEAIGP